MVNRKRIPVYKKSWRTLTSRQKLFRERSLEVLSTSRKSSKSLSKIARDFGTSVKTVINNTNAFKKINRKWIPKKYDRISRVMKINENGKEISIEINDSRRASLIGKYHNNVKRFLESGNVKLLLKFKHKRIKDVNNTFHSFETESEKIIEIHSRIEEPEFYEIYGDGS
ncbi:MAG: hypothetical protein IIA83_02200 [Thaumarchaeota archaeon]|nr:hypothetical protein [Nitrososphaerota archaeon]